MSTKCILLIDDEPDIHTIVQLALSMGTDWSLLNALSGPEGIALAEANHPDAILLDSMMPYQDGAITLEQLQQNPTTHHIPVIFLTANAQASNRRHFYALGAKGMITKPFEPLTLGSQIAGFLGWSD